MSEDIKIVAHHILVRDYEDSFRRLFQECFKSNWKEAKSAFEKYKETKEGWSAIGIVDGEPVAFYNTFIFSFSGERCALSVDTMSNGRMRSATQKLGSALYARLRNELNVVLVCGFPNDKIVKIRESKLSWKMYPHLLKTYFVITTLGRQLDYQQNFLEVFNRSGSKALTNSIFGRPVVGANQIFNSRVGNFAFFWASLRKDFAISIALPAKYWKKFGYVELSEGSLSSARIASGDFALTFDSIDVP